MSETRLRLKQDFVQNKILSTSTPIHDVHGKTIKQEKGSDWTATMSHLSGNAGRGRTDKTEFSNDLLSIRIRLAITVEILTLIVMFWT